MQTFFLVVYVCFSGCGLVVLPDLYFESECEKVRSSWADNLVGTNWGPARYARCVSASNKSRTTDLGLVPAAPR